MKLEFTKPKLIISAEEKEKLLNHLRQNLPICNLLDCPDMSCSDCPLDKLTDQYEDIRDAIRDMVLDAKVEG